VNKSLHSKIALVTGANGGLGTSVTRVLLDSGATVVGVARHIQQGEFESSAFVPINAELTSGDGAQKMTDEVLSSFGRIDVLAHLVGGFAGGKTISELDDTTLEKMLDLNLRSAFYVLRAVIPHMRRAGNGRIIAIGSRAAEDPGAGVGAYSLSKAALVSLIRTVARENKQQGITANVILPGTIDTPANRDAMPGADRRTWVQPDSIASLIVWLASDAGKDVTGAAIPVYGAGF